MEWTRIYFDTNSLEEGKWPELSAALRNVLRFAKDFGVEVCLCEAVEREAEAHWIRDIRQERNKLPGKITPLVRRVGLAVDLSIPSEEQLHQAHKAAVVAVKAQYGILTTPIAEKDVAWFFQKAIEHVPPFADEGRNFQDFVILMSILEHLKAAPTKLAVLLTTDPDLRQENVNVWAKEMAVTLNVMRLNDLYQAFQEQEKDKAKEAETAAKRRELTALWGGLKRSAEEQLKPHYQEIEELLTRCLNELPFMTARPESSIMYVLEALQWLRVLEVYDVDLPFPDPHVAVAGILLNAKVRFRFGAKMRPFEYSKLQLPKFETTYESTYRLDARATMLEGKTLETIHDLQVSPLGFPTEARRAYPEGDTIDGMTGDT